MAEFCGYCTICTPFKACIFFLCLVSSIKVFERANVDEIGPSPRKPVSMVEDICTVSCNGLGKLGKPYNMGSFKDWSPITNRPITNRISAAIVVP
jgi:hypothetical protein